MLAHLYEPETKAFVGSVFADPDPLQAGQYIVPAYGTLLEPPKVTELERAVFDVKTNVWQVADDYRTISLFDKLTAQRVQNLCLGEKPNWDLFTNKKPPQLQQNQTCVWDTEKKDWKLVADFRGQTAYDKQTKLAKQVDKVGALADNLTLLCPLPGYIWEKYKWVPSVELMAEQEDLIVKEALKQNDVSTVRAMREWFLEHADLAETSTVRKKLVEQEQNAADLRGRLNSVVKK